MQRRHFLTKKKQPAKLVARVNYRFLDDQNGKVPVTIDLLNSGDIAYWNTNIQIHFRNNICIDDRINFIAPKEIFNYYIGFLSYDGEFRQGCIELITGTQIALEQINRSDNFSVTIEGNHIEVNCNI